jgi:hypothetical protein
MKASSELMIREFLKKSYIGPVALALLLNDSIESLIVSISFPLEEATRAAINWLRRHHFPRVFLIRGVGVP